MKILVLSCDKYKDTFEAFHHCMEKYWPDHPEIYYSTETIKNPYYKTINKNYPISKWSKRIHDSVEEIDDDKILIMCDDIFLRERVDNDYISYLASLIVDNIASINLHESLESADMPYVKDILKKSEHGRYKTSVMCSMWQKDKMLNVFNIESDPWKFEETNHHCGYDYLINDKKKILSFGRSPKGGKWGIYRGKWYRECLNFLRSEGLHIDTSRGIVD